MRTIAYICLCVGLLCGAGGLVRAAEPTLADKELSEAVELPSQAPVEGVVDLLLELREERPGCSLIVLTHFPQGFGAEADKSIADVAGVLHGDAYIEVQERSNFVFEQRLSAISSAQAAGKALPDQDPRGWGNSFASTVTFAVSLPSDNYVSLLFRTDMSGGGAHANWIYRTITLEKASGKAMTLQELFPGKEDIESLLAPLIAKALSIEEDELSAETLDIGLNRILLLPEGMRVFYAPYEIAAYSEGEFIVDIPLKDLRTVGASPAVWKER